jgi:hypothetical protein
MMGAAWRSWVVQNDKATIVLWTILTAIFSLIYMVLEVSERGVLGAGVDLYSGKGPQFLM